ncbi:MAG: cyclopropane-fatty-acyl-phospholipid synthase family protein [Acidobacteriota bacterium]
MRRLMGHRLRQEQRRLANDPAAAERWSEELRDSPIAPVPEQANDQHYEVPAAFYELVLGRHLKYSSAFWPEGATTLDQAEDAMLALTAARAQLEDGQRVLDLGCGWGSLTLWAAERMPDSRFVAVSNSGSQREHVLDRCRERGLTNVEVITADINDFVPSGQFDRVVSVEMFEHARNWEELLARIAGWLVEHGSLFVHVFCHRSYAYPFETEGEDNWMGRHFFTGGQMPSEEQLGLFQRDLHLAEQWRVGGEHYQKTSEAWLANLDARRDEVHEVLAGVHGPDEAETWVQRWRMFFMACAELFGYRNGDEWLVAHYRMTKPGRPRLVS